MSRIGKLPVTIPSGVKVAVDANAVRLEGPKGKLQTTVPAGVEVKVEGNLLRVERKMDDRNIRALHGLTRKLIANMTEFGKSPYLNVARFEQLGYRGVLFPVSLLRVALRAIEHLLAELKNEGSQRESVQCMMSRAELYELLRYEPNAGPAPMLHGESS